MELSLTDRLRGAQRPLPMERGGANSEQTAGAAAPRRLAPWDRVALSREALAYMEEQHRKNMERIREESEKWAAAPEGDGEDAELEMFSESMKAMKRCQEIAARIMRGDKVPPQDEAYLMKNDPTGYKLALAMRRPKGHPKEWESVLDDEEKRTESGDESDGEGEAVSAAPESSGGGEAPSAGAGEA